MIDKMKRLIVTILMLSVISCAEKLIQEPEDLIPRDQMIAILNDMAILNAARTTSFDKMERAGVETMEFIFSKYGIDSMQFVRSDRYYASKPMEYESIYSTVEARLEEEVKRFKEIKKLNDSLKLLKRDSIRNTSLGKKAIKPNPSKKDQP